MKKNMAKNLKSTRNGNQQSAYEFVKCAGIGQTAMKSYLKGEGNPRLDTIEQLCKTFSLTPNQLLLGDSVEQFLLDHVIPTITFVSEWSFEDQMSFVDQLLQMIQLFEKNKTHYGGGAPHEAVEMAGKMEALV